MKNGPYTLAVAPAAYPGKKYRGRYVYEHHLVWWQNTGQLVPSGFLIHHKDENKRRNVFDNLELQEWGKHTADHVRRRPLKEGPVDPSTTRRRKKRELNCQVAQLVEQSVVTR